MPQSRLRTPKIINHNSARFCHVHNSKVYNRVFCRGILYKHRHCSVLELEFWQRWIQRRVIPCKPADVSEHTASIFMVKSLLHAGFLPGLLCDPESERGIFLRSVGLILPDYMASYSRRENSSVYFTGHDIHLLQIQISHCIQTGNTFPCI